MIFALQSADLVFLPLPLPIVLRNVTAAYLDKLLTR